MVFPTNVKGHVYVYFLYKKSSTSHHNVYVYFLYKKSSTSHPNYGFECLQPLRPAPQLTVTKISTYTIYLYVFITVKTAPQLNRLSCTDQTAVTIRSLSVILASLFFFSDTIGMKDVINNN